MQTHKNENYSTSEQTIFNHLCQLKHRDLQKECLLRGIEFEKVGEFSHPQLVSWFYKNYDNTQNQDALTNFDVWLDSILEKRGYPPNIAFRSPLLRFSYVEPIMQGISPKLERVQNNKTTKSETQQTSEKPLVKVKREKNREWGINTGTKKYLTYELTIKDKLPIEDIITKVQEEYPEADEKSIKIWSKRAEKLI